MKNLVVYGPPGTGKSRFLINRIGDYLKERPTKRVLFCSHTRAAAQVAVERWDLTDKRVEIGTLHSLCFKALKLSKAQTVDYQKLESFGQEFGIDMSDEGIGKDFMDVLALARSKCVKPEEGYERSWRPGTQSHFSAFAKSYEQWKSQYGYMDFNDMLDFGAARITRPMVDYGEIAIDEAQDLTPLHWKVIYRLVELLPDARVIVAGDDDQALYSFAGADPAGMLEFGNRTGAEAQVLSQSYRITEQVFDLAHAIITRVQNRVPKRYAPRTGLDGRAAQGKYEVWPNMDYLQIDRTRDSLLLYNDRFVRGEVEPLLQENGFLYKALNGYPSPLDSRAGRTLKAVFTHDDEDLLDYDTDLRPIVRGGLSARGQQAWDNISEREVLARIRRHDWSVLSIRPQHIDYLRGLDYSREQNLRISTMHGAKGLQGDDVHLILSLSQRAWAEFAINPDHLHRLLYTAVTRTKENLYLYDGENGYELPTEFR